MTPPPPLDASPPEGDPPPLAPDAEAAAFVARWSGAIPRGSERAVAQAFLLELCDLLRVARPDPAPSRHGEYRFEKDIPGDDGTRRYADLYRRNRFVLEAKALGGGPADAPGLPGLGPDATEGDRRARIRRSPGWARDMLRAKGQAEGYSRALPASEGSPPFLIVADVGFCLDLWADFSGTGRHYAQFPDRERHRLYLDDLRDPANRRLLREVWERPRSLDPALRRTAVTRDIAAVLARVAKGLERRHAPGTVATFLMRCVFSMFAQSVGLFPARDTFAAILRDCLTNPPMTPAILGEFWRAMDKGGASVAARGVLRRFNGGLFAPGVHGPVEGLALDPDEIARLADAAAKDWSEVEPAIFGTLLENALDDPERASLGAHFTPRAFVERLVIPTVMDPLRADWDGYKNVVEAALRTGDRAAAAKAVRAFHARLCAVRVLDPACGTGNFLYVTLELMKRLEGEVLDLLADLEGGAQDRFDLVQATVDPHGFLGLEKNARAVPVAELVLWIGWLQWHLRTRRGRDVPDPVLKDFANIRRADALLDYAEEVPERDAAGRLVTRQGKATKDHPITGEKIPDEADRIPVTRPVNPKPTAWPEAEFIVGNPPFVAGQDMREDLGSGYAEALWKTYPRVPGSADLAMHFWWKAAGALRTPPPGAKPAGRKAKATKEAEAPKPVARRFGFITSNSITQTFCRRVVAEALDGKPPLRLVFAIPDHPWSDGAGTAAVRIAMTVVDDDATKPGTLAEVTAETPGRDGVPDVALAPREGRINPDLTVGLDLTAAKPLRANERLASMGVKLHGDGFIVTPTLARALGLGRADGLDAHIRPFANGRDLTQRSRGTMAVDLFGLTEAQVRDRFPDVYQHVLLRVKPERDQNNRATYRDNWWVFGEPRRELRPALSGLSRYVGTTYTAKHRVFSFVPSGTIAESMVIVIATDDAFHLGVLSSRFHVAWALATGGTLEDRPRYNKSLCFDPFPFPDPPPAARAAVAEAAEALDAHRRARLALHPHLTLTGLYNALDALRAAEATGRDLTPAERDLHDAGLVSLLRDLHARLDAAVARDRQAALAVDAPADAAATAATAPPWPADPARQYVALRAALAAAAAPAAPSDLRRRFARPPQVKTVTDMLGVLAALGQARALPDGRYAP